MRHQFHNDKQNSLVTRREFIRLASSGLLAGAGAGLVQEALGESPGCWVEFYEHFEFKRGHRRFHGPFATPKLDDHLLDNGKRAGDEIDSLKTGPSTWLAAYEDERYEDTIRRFGPNLSIPNLDDDPWDFGDEIDSFILFDTKPIWWDSELLSMRRCTPSDDWKTLEYTINTPVIAGFLRPAGAKVRVKAVATITEETLDGVTPKYLTAMFGQIQIKVPVDYDVIYAWRRGSGAIIDLPSIPIPSI